MAGFHFRSRYTWTEVPPFTLILGGLVFLVVAVALRIPDISLLRNSVETELYVVEVNSRLSRNTGSSSTQKKTTMFQPVFQATSTDGTTLEYAGNSWVAPKPHDVGDRVPGRVNWKTGRMKSIKMLRQGATLTGICALIGMAMIIGGVWKRVRG